ncbi:zinc metalloprotease HtpX [Methanothrix thermoacetophila]|uniref:Protease HtpX homolog n=1 Tax=Methanothrix thermoacetophila (strain DSM 6194 / JCM 14653 / NBRC 101360 / PT) TaxID=349307 RepID=A0B7G7_METTP|nr:zinc metalloprotease HtpX [Methanothrix thermoacetophila]ABK14641.1 Heat shock protein, Metallo peptidase, MEROPS family M48B [Methanothrix thermoacetophila PT]
MVRWSADRGLQARMLLTMFLLAAVYLIFINVIMAMGVGIQGVVLIMGLFLFIQYFYSDKIALASVGARIVSESEAPELHELVGRLCAIAGLPKPRIAIVRTDIPNAFATGRSQSSSVVAVTTGLLRRLDKSELEAVLAHELSHIKNRDVAVMTIASFLSTVASVIVQNIFFLGDRRDRESGNLFAVWLVSLIVWIVSFILIRTLSRYREFSADRGSAIITGRPSALVSALMKISGTMARIPREDLRKVEGMNAFFIIPTGAIANLLSTHPPIEARIAALERLEREIL